MMLLVMDDEQKDAAEALNADSPLYKVEGRIIDNENSELFGKWIIPARVLDSPEYSVFHELLSTYPIIDLNPKDIFAPPEDDEP